MNTNQPTERTPLIENYDDSTNAASSPESLPFILEMEKDIYADSEYPAVHRIIERKADVIETSPSTTLTLKLLLCIRYLSGAYFHLGKDDWVDSRSAEQDVTELAVQSWKDLQRLAWSQVAFDEALWARFPLESDKDDRISLIETILSSQAGVSLSIQLDDGVALSLLRAWKNGRPRSIHSAPGSTLGNLLLRTESIATPRVLHLIDLAFYLGYLATLTHYLIRPYAAYPAESPRPDYHFYCIAIYALCRFLDNPFSLTHASCILTLAAFLSALPSMPRRRENSYNVLLFTFFMHVVQLLLPLSPSFALLGPRSTSFAVSTMLQDLFVSVLIPALAFFLPIIFVLLVLLLASLDDIFVTVNDLVAFDVFLFTGWCSGLLFTCLAVYMTLSSSSSLLPSAKFYHPGVPASWNAYGTNVGVSLRRHLCRSVITYSTPYFFPVPINLIPSIFVRFPHAVLRSFGEKNVAAWLKESVEPVLWRLLVLPLAFVFGSAWLWR